MLKKQRHKYLIKLNSLIEIRWLNLLIEINKQKYYSRLSNKSADLILVQDSVSQRWRCFEIIIYSLYSTFKWPK